MSNMSYCRFENTFPDLKDCLEALGEGEKLSESEKKYARKMLKLMADFLLEQDIITAEKMFEDGGYSYAGIDEDKIEPKIEKFLE